MPVSEQAARIKVLVLDVDGVLTDGGLYYDHQGNVSKRFNVQDGLGIKVAQAQGLQVGVITGLDQPCVSIRVRELGITHYYAGFLDKLESLEAIRAACGVTYEEMAYMGDDWVDVSPMRKVGLALCVANAQPEVVAAAAWRSTLAGGHGAVREAIRMLLESQGRLEGALGRMGA